MINQPTSKEFIGEEEWDNFKPTDMLSPDISGKLWSNINKNTPTPAVHSSYFRYIGVAASVLLVAGLSWLFLVKEQKTTAASATAVAQTANVVNATPREKALTLSDGSTVALSPNSRIAYPKAFTSLEREVIIDGDASFAIARDATRPFSVHCNAVLITVLGTRFTVNSYGSNTITKVILQEGRVMVRIADSSSPDKNDYYLTPGDVFVYKKASPARLFHLEKDKDDDYVFNNLPLDVVFDQLQLIYNTKIVYKKAQLGNRTFIGKLDKKDPLLPILQSIVLLNNFSLHNEGDSLVIGSPN